jgi:hypothetical protein
MSHITVTERSLQHPPSCRALLLLLLALLLLSTLLLVLRMQAAAPPWSCSILLLQVGLGRTCTTRPAAAQGCQTCCQALR